MTHARYTLHATLLLALAAAPAAAAVYSVEVKPPAAPGQEHYMGAGPGTALAPAAATSPRFGTIGYDNYSLLKNGKPYTPIMGEFHYSRYPANEWRQELLKMKAGGINLISTYIFWIHHEEVQGQFDWQGNKDLHAFIQLCGELELPILVRIGPWCHGEVRNGGHPDWVEALPRKRRNDPAYMDAVRPLYAQISQQLKGLMWQEGGPIIGIQLENESPNGAYLVALKNMAREAGMDVPLYTKTGWPALSQNSPVPFGELLPFFGTYAEGFWDRTLESMPQEKYWQSFSFNPERIDTAIASDIFGTAPAGNRPDETAMASYPYLTCEIGTGMIPSYHRRMHMSTMDNYSIALVKIGSGVNLPGYYLYHGATNPESKSGKALSESQATGMWNDLPNKSYDWDSPIGEFGQIRETYHYLRRLHMFLQDYGDTLARMPATFPASIKEKTDNKTVRWSVRSDGKSGYLFVNNYQRALDMPAKPDTQFEIKLTSHTVKFPSEGMTMLPGNSSFFWPFGMDLGGVTLESATAQPLCKLQRGNTTYTFFLQTPGVESEFLLPRECVIDSTTFTVVPGASSLIARDFRAGITPAIESHLGDRKQVIFLLSENMARELWKGSFSGQEVLYWYRDNLFFDTNKITFYVPLAGSFTLFPTEVIPGTGPKLSLNPNLAASAMATATATQIQQPGAPRAIKMGSQKVAEQPSDADFAGDQPAVFRIALSSLESNPRDDKNLLRIHYTGDVARLYLGDKLIEDNFYNGQPMDYALRRLPAGTTELTLKILPLQKNAPIMLAQWPDMQGKDSVATLDRTEVIHEQTIILEAK